MIDFSRWLSANLTKRIRFQKFFPSCIPFSIISELTRRDSFLFEKTISIRFVLFTISILNRIFPASGMFTRFQRRHCHNCLPCCERYLLNFFIRHNRLQSFESNSNLLIMPKHSAFLKNVTMFIKVIE